MGRGVGGVVGVRGVGSVGGNVLRVRAYVRIIIIYYCPGKVKFLSIGLKALDCIGCFGLSALS